MSRYTYAGDFVNPVGSWRVASKPDPENPDSKVYYVEVFRKEEREIDGVIGEFSFWSPHTSGDTWSDEDQAHEWIEDVEQSFEDDYDAFLEEEHDSIVRMERYEQFMNEY